MTAAKDHHQPPREAIALLKADHHEVKMLFADFEAAGDDERDSIATLICTALRVHAQIEEEILYPSARESLGSREATLLDEALVEHGAAMELIKKIETSGSADPLFEAWVTVLGEYVKHHVAEEEGELFPKLRKSKMDLVSIGAELSARKAELLRETGHSSTNPGMDGASHASAAMFRGTSPMVDGAKSRSGL
jgi:iron-sulfur cluster repair protein YtfE (RIC family)